MELQAQHNRVGFLSLPREIRDVVYDLIIPTEKVYIFLLVQESFDFASLDHFPFDRGYAFPTFQTSIFRVSQQVHSEACSWWFRKGHFRLDMGEYLGLRNPIWTLSSEFIGSLAHCDLTITVPAWPLRQETSIDPAELKFGTWMLRRVAKSVVEALVNGESIRRMEIRLRDLEYFASWTAHADHVPESLIEYFYKPILLPLDKVKNYEMSVEGEAVTIQWTDSLARAYYKISMGMHMRLRKELEKLSRPPKPDHLPAQKRTTCLGRFYELVKQHDETRHLRVYFDGDWYLYIP